MKRAPLWLVLSLVVGCGGSEAAVDETPRDEGDAGVVEEPAPDAIDDAAEDAVVDATSEPEAGDVTPTAAPVCPPGVTKVTSIDQLTDADRVNGRVTPDVGTVPAASSVAGDPAVYAPYQVIATDVTVPHPIGDDGQSAPGTLYAPSNDGKVPLLGQFPLVVVMPGFSVGYDAYASYSRAFAKAGFMVLGVNTAPIVAATSNHQQEAYRAIAAIDWALSDATVAPRVDPTKIAIAGHSKGGKVAFFAASLDARIDLVIGWDPSNAGGAPCFLDPVGCNAQPVAPNCNTANGAGTGVLQGMHAESWIVGVPPDATTNPEAAHNSLNFYRGAPSPATFFAIKGAHADFVSDGLGALAANKKVSAFAIRASIERLLTMFQGRTLDASFAPGGASFDPDSLLTGPVRTK